MPCHVGNVGSSGNIYEHTHHTGDDDVQRHLPSVCPPCRGRERLDRAPHPDEVPCVTDVAHRIAAILHMEPDLDENHEAVKAGTYDWPGE